MLALTLAFLAACAAKVALSGFDDVGTLTAHAVLAMAIMPLLACLVSLVCPSLRACRGIAGFYALYHQITDHIIANLALLSMSAWSWLARLLSPVMACQGAQPAALGHLAATCTPSSHKRPSSAFLELGGTKDIARAATCHSAQENHPKDRHGWHPYPPLPSLKQDAGAWNGARNARKIEAFTERQ